jgi:hypothetical protein
MSNFIVTVQNPDTVIRSINYSATVGSGPQNLPAGTPDGETNTNPTPQPQSISIPQGATSVNLLNRGAASVEYGLDVTPATALAAGASLVVVLSTHKVLQIQGLNLLVDCIFTLTDV